MRVSRRALVQLILSARTGRRAATEESTMNSMARGMFELVEPIGVIPLLSRRTGEEMFALGFTNYWDTYFAGRVAPLGVRRRRIMPHLGTWLAEWSPPSSGIMGQSARTTSPEVGRPRVVA